MLRSDMVPVPRHQAPCPDTKMDVVQTRQYSELKMFIKKNSENVLTIEKSAANLELVFQQPCKKVNTPSNKENLFRLVPVLGYGARVLPLELVPGHRPQV